MESSPIWSSPSYPNREEMITSKVTSTRADELARRVSAMSKKPAAGIKVLDDGF